MNLAKKAEYATSWIDSIADHADENSSIRKALLGNLADKIQDAIDRIDDQDRKRIEDLIG